MHSCIMPQGFYLEAKQSVMEVKKEYLDSCVRARNV